MIDATMLARMQFAANITFHILFPTITIALCWILLFFKLRFNKTKDKKWMFAYQFWVKIFALSFALGIVSGITMSFQFGTNWPGFMITVGNIAGPLLAFEVLTAFFLEATFLGIMLFGTKRVSNKIHTLATVLVAVGTSTSAFWILALNTWMQNPVGFEMIDGVAHATNWLTILFNQSLAYRLIHVLLASGITCSFLLAGISAYRLLKHDKCPSVIATLKTGIYLGALLIPLQLFVGDLHGLDTLKHQPQKIAAMEGIWETEKPADLRLFAIPDNKTKQNKYEVSIPKLGSLILKHSLDGEVKGVNAFKDHPPVATLFFSFRIMVAFGMLMLAVSWYGVWYLKKHIHKLNKFFLKIMLWMTFSGWFATVAGWYTTEVGRQPWLVTGVLSTGAAVSDVPPTLVGITFAVYIAVYLVLITAYIATIFFMARKANTIIAAKPETLTSDRGLA